MRTHTDAVFVELGLDGMTAYGEATLPPYLPYTQASTMACLSSIDLSGIGFPFDTKAVVTQIKALHFGLEPPALAALDMALWALEAKMKNCSVQDLLGIYETDTALRTYTISVCDRKEMAERISFGRNLGFNTFKLKMNGIDDRQMLADFRSLSDGPFAVDANQAWKDINTSLSFAKELVQQGCILIEQPFHKTDRINTQKLSGALTIPIIADESCQAIDDIDRVQGCFSGINVKLQKCGGITPAFEMIKHARSSGLKVLIGCMSESIIGCTAGEVLSPLCDWNDLDGTYLVKDVPFRN
jgi:L-alanine-DL-glutamate epimerase-like enolase superfamily enzyme